MAKRRKAMKRDDAIGLIAFLFLAGAVIVGMVQAALQWLAEHWYVVPLGIAALIGVAVVVIRNRLQQARTRQQRLQQLRYSLRQIDAMSPGQFEDACRDLLRRDGFEARRVGRSNDQAVDVIGHDHVGRVIAVQCKQAHPQR